MCDYEILVVSEQSSTGTRTGFKRDALEEQGLLHLVEMAGGEDGDSDWCEVVWRDPRDQSMALLLRRARGENM